MLNPPERKPTDEQVAIYDLLRTTDDNILINALAGSGKTTTLEDMIPYVKGTWLYLAFNKAIVKEAEKRLPGGGSIRTLNSMGYKCWRDGNGKGTVDLEKTKNLWNAYVSEFSKEDARDLWDQRAEIVAAYSMAKHLGYIPEGKFSHARRLCNQEQLCARLEDRLSEFALEAVDTLLCNSIKAAYAGAVDFDDQVYMPALFGGSYPRFTNVLVDEDQDLSPVNHALLEKLVKGRIIAVGDRWQSIYGFRGADTNSVDKLKVRYGMTEMPLSYSFRCPENIVKAAHWRVPHMKWVKPGGNYGVLQALDIDDIPEEAAIVCRNNAPLFRAAFGLLSRQRSVSVAGSDIGPKIVRLLGKIGTDGDTSEDLIAKIEAWKLDKLTTSNSPQTIQDTAECLKVFASWGANLRQAIGYAEHIFKQQGSIKLITGHKAKGMEWGTVYHLDSDLLGKHEQDLNLRYVITTRSWNELYEIKTEEIQW